MSLPLSSSKATGSGVRPHQDGCDDVRPVLDGLDVLHRRPVDGSVHIAPSLVPVANLKDQTSFSQSGFCLVTVHGGGQCHMTPRVRPEHSSIVLLKGHKLTQASPLVFLVSMWLFVSFFYFNSLKIAPFIRGGELMTERRRGGEHAKPPLQRKRNSSTFLGPLRLSSITVTV